MFIVCCWCSFILNICGYNIDKNLEVGSIKSLSDVFGSRIYSIWLYNNNNNNNNINYV